MDVVGEFEGEGGEAAFVFAESDAVDPDFGGGHDTFKVYEDALALAGGWELEAAAIDGDEFIELVVEAVPGERDVGVGDDDALEGGVIEFRRGGCVGKGAAVAPVAIDGQDRSAMG